MQSEDVCRRCSDNKIPVADILMFCRRNEIDLCARLLGVSAVGLNANPGLVVFAVLIKIVEGVFVLPIFGLIFTSYTNGKVVPNGMSLSVLLICIFPSCILMLSLIFNTCPKILEQPSWILESLRSIIVRAWAALTYCQLREILYDMISCMSLKWIR